MIKNKVPGIIARFGCMAIAASFASCVTGCGKAIVLTSQQQNLVAEYSAQAVLKHDKNYKDLKVKKLDKNEKETETTTKNDTSSTEVVTEDMSGNKTQAETTSDNEVQTPTEDMASLMGMSPATLTYTGMEVVSKYPDTSETQFVLNATQGNKLLVLKISLTNNTASDINVPMMSGNTSLKASVNGEEHNALLTLLLDALNTYTGTLSPGQTEPLVLVFQIAEGEEANIESIDLIIKSEAGKTTFGLK